MTYTHLKHKQLRPNKLRTSVSKAKPPVTVNSIEQQGVKYVWMLPQQVPLLART